MDNDTAPKTNARTRKENDMTKQEKNISRCRDMSNGTREDIRELSHILGSLADRLQSRVTDNAVRNDKADWPAQGSLGYLRSQLLETLDGFNALMTQEELEAASRILADTEKTWS